MFWLGPWIRRWWHVLARWICGHASHKQRPCRRRNERPSLVEPIMRSHAKPAWAREEILLLAARDPHASCRRLADIFNRRHAGGNGMSVGKSFVSDLLRRQHTEVMRLRRDIRRRRYAPGPRNAVWGVDGTGKTDQVGSLHFLLGIIDHGTRRCLTLSTLKDKASITILRSLLDAIERYGAPKATRTDNEAIFQSRMFRVALAWLGIRHQGIEPHCPWQNGRIERFFGALKASLDHWTVADHASLNTSLQLFRCWYNHVRPHQHLQGRTPVEAWDNIDIQRHPPKRHLWFETWEGLLQGEYLQR